MIPKNTSLLKVDRLKNLSAHSFWQLVLCSALGFLIFSGCGAPANQLAPVSGLITLDGEPLENAKVIFIPEKHRKDGLKLPYSFAITNEKGRFILATETGRKGAVIGNHSVVIMTKNVPEKAETKSSDIDTGDDDKKPSTSKEDLDSNRDGNSKDEKSKPTNKPQDASPQLGEQVIPERIPPKYNSESELTFTVVAGTGNQANFSLKSSL